jgi:hypothetical protein
MKEYLASIYVSEIPPCLVRNVMMSLFHNIAAVFLLFKIINWIVDFILGSRWLRRVARQAFGVFCEVVVLACTFVCEVILLASDVVDFVASNIEAGMKGVLVFIARSVKFAIEMILEVMAPDDEEEDAGQRIRTTIADVERNTRYSSAVVETRRRAKGRAERLRVETSLEDDPNRNWSNEHGNLSPGSSPSTRSTRSTRHTGPTPSARSTGPNRQHLGTPVTLAGIGPSGLASSSTSAKPSTAFTTSFSGIIGSDVRDALRVPGSTHYYFPGRSPSPGHLSYEEYMEWCSVRGIRRGGFGDGGSGTASVSTAESAGIHTPSANSSSLNPFDAPAASSSSSDGICTPSSSSCSPNAITTPSASSASTAFVHTPASTRTLDSGDSSRPGTPDSASSSASESTVIHTPPSAGIRSGRGTPDSTSSSGSESTVIRTPSP